MTRRHHGDAAQIDRAAPAPGIDSSGRVPRRQLGHVQIGAVTYPLIDVGDWATTDGYGGVVFYHAGNLVQLAGVTYLCVAATSTSSPPSGDWETWDESKFFLRADRVWAKTLTTSLTGGFATYPDGVLSIPSLAGYWPLTEGVSPYADLSGLSPTGPAGATGGSPLMTYDYTPGPLTIADEGAVAFNGTGSTSGAECLFVANIGTPRYDLDGTDFTIAGWINPFTSALTWLGPVVGNMANVGGIGGWQIYCSYPNRELVFAVQAGSTPDSAVFVPGGIAPAGWVHVVAVFKKIDLAFSSHSTGTLYYNGAQVATAVGLNSGSPTTVNVPTTHGGFTMGRGISLGTGGLTRGYYGGLGHVAIYTSALTAVEAFTLYASGNAAAVGSELVADGLGGYTILPPRTIYVNGA